MQLSILDNTIKGAGNQRRGINLNQFKAGDKLDARIVQIASSGRTVLQFSGFRAVVDTFAGGREGDVIQFEVLPDEKPKSRHDQAGRSSATLSTKSAKPPMNKAVRLNMITEAVSSRPEAHKASRLIPKSISQTPQITQPTNSQTSLPAQSFNIVSTLFIRFIKTWEPLRSEKTQSVSIKKAPLTKGLSLEKPADRSTIIETDRFDRSRDAATHSDYTLFNLGDYPVKMKIYGHSPRSAMDKDQLLFKAIFLLNMEYTGTVRTDVLMGTNEIKVDFFVENEDYRIKFVKALPGLTDDLSRLIEHCYCRVAVSQTKIHDFLIEEGNDPDSSRFDVQA